MKVGLIGTGMVAATHVAAIRDAGLELATVLARDPAKTRAFAETHGARAVESVAALAEGVDFVILLTPPNARQDHVAELARAGVPILAEKPLERDLARATALVDLCEAANVPFGVTLQHRMRPAAKALAKEMAGLGQIASVDLRVPWWRDPSYYDEPGRGTYERDGGGVLLTQAIHSIDLMLHLCGPVAAVQAMVATTPLHDLEAEDFAAAALRFRGGATGALMASVTHRPGGTEVLTVNGTDGSAVLVGGELTVTGADGERRSFGEPAAGTGGGADPMAFQHDWHQAVIEDFAAALREGRAPAIPARDTLPAIALIDAIQASARSGQREEIENV
ncbi:Gfo/Idh/MocA family oxidoreductase [uncultured Jannaschia sp.]|uniref:Gfo/Idh/MocA family protein n=1 Tax=uncultured Jannaschia sp. TaxID=293347 RepID=UPI0026187B90|nr:Gfo/Idh/MocA family oxidoreductase [uncultured Jannaschia sp.]